MKRIVFKNLDGSCGIIIPAPKALLEMTIEEIAAKDVPNGLSYRIADTVNVPADRTFRNAWTDDNPTQTVDVDMIKARDLHMDNLRVIRDKKMKLLDIEQMKGFDVSIAKQELRDIPQTYDLSVATTPEELKLMVPASLL